MTLLAILMLAPAASPAAPTPSPLHGSPTWAISVTIAPPPLIVYDQPFCPGPGFIWTPGYWAWTDDDGYYWVPGTWVEAPFQGALWTPGYWDWDDASGVYVWNEGYWGPVIGFYGGVVYGFGYTGVGYEGGYWRNGGFYYNTAVNRVNTTTVTNVYNKTVINNTVVENVSFHGGNGGTTAQPTAEQKAAANQPHTPPTPVQKQQQHLASTNRTQFASVNHGLPAVAATPKPAAFTSPEVVKPNPSAPANKIVANRVAEIKTAPRNAKPTPGTQPKMNGNSGTPTPAGGNPKAAPPVKNEGTQQPKTNPPREAPQRQPIPQEKPQQTNTPHAMPQKPVPENQNKPRPVDKNKNQKPEPPPKKAPEKAPDTVMQRSTLPWGNAVRLAQAKAIPQQHA